MTYETRPFYIETYIGDTLDIRITLKLMGVSGQDFTGLDAQMVVILPDGTEVVPDSTDDTDIATGVVLRRWDKTTTADWTVGKHYGAVKIVVTATGEEYTRKEGVIYVKPKKVTAT